MYVPSSDWLHSIAKKLIFLHQYLLTISSDQVVVVLTDATTGRVGSKTCISFQAWKSEMQCEAYFRRLLPVLDGQVFSVAET
jgi:hypothetical protein